MLHTANDSTVLVPTRYRDYGIIFDKEVAWLVVGEVGLAEGEDRTRV